MKILLKSDHIYPFKKEKGAGFEPKRLPSGSNRRLNDNLAKGLIELGHEVFYLLEGVKADLPEGMHFVSEPTLEADVFHNLQSSEKPWIQTCHRDPSIQNEREYIDFIKHTVFVSQTLAKYCNSQRYVLNGIDPIDFIYKETKADYLFFICWLDWAMLKGLDIAISLSRKTGLPLVVAGGSSYPAQIQKISELCKKNNVLFAGDVDGIEKANLFAEARALIFPTQIEQESFGLVMAEALMSGTPVISSNKGACAELISSDVGFVCQNEADYLNAIENIGKISPENCRKKAMEQYHYLRMAKDYVLEYEKEIGRI